MRSGWTPRFRELLHAADPVLHLIAEVVRVRSSDVKDTFDEWEAADATTGLDTLLSGGITLEANTSAVITQASDDGTTSTGLSRTLPAMALIIRWEGVQPERRELASLTARLHPKADSLAAKEVHEWRAQIFRVVERDPDPLTARLVVAPMSSIVAVTATGETAGDVIFDFRLDEHVPVVGPPPRYIGQDGTKSSHPQTVIRVWAVTSTGDVAGNVAWMSDSTLGDTITGVNYSVSHYSVSDGDTSEGVEEGSGTVLLLGAAVAEMPRFTLNRASYTAATVTFSTALNRIQGIGTTGVQEIIAEAQAPKESSVVCQIRPAGGGSWTTVVDGDLIGVDNTAQGGSDLSGLTPAASWDVRATLTPSSDGFARPTLRRLGVREVTKTDLAGVATVQGGMCQVEPRTLKGNITRAEVRILKTGEKDYLDYGSQILSANHIGEIEVRVWVGDPTYEYLTRPEWMHIDSYEVEDYHNEDTAHVLTCISPLRRLRRLIPPFVATSGANGEREPIEYANVTIKAAAADIVDGKIGLPGRFRGPLLESATVVTKTLFDTDAKDELDRLAYLDGRAIITSQGRVRAVQMMRDGPGSAPPVAVFLPGDYTPVEITPGYSARVDEFFVPFGWENEANSGSGTFGGESRYYNATATAKLGGRGLQTTDRLEDETAKWIPSDTLGSAVARRVPHHFANGMILWRIRANYAHPHLEPGDPVVVVTDRFVARSPITDREIRGPIAGLGIVSTVGDCWGRDLTVWVPSFDDIVAADGDVTRIGYKRPNVLEAVPVWGINGAATVRVRANKPDSTAVRLAAATGGFPTEATVRASPLTALDSHGWATVSMGGTWAVESSFWLSGFAYENVDGSGREQLVMFTQLYKVQLLEGRVILTLDQDGDALYAVWDKTAPVKQIKWLVDVTNEPTEAEVTTSGAIDTTGSVLVHTFDPNGDKVQRIYFGFFGRDSTPVQVTDLMVIPYTYRVGNDRPTVDLEDHGRGTGGVEKWRAVVLDGGDQVALYIRTYNKGTTPPAYTRVPATGYESDPLVYPFSFARPADGDPNVVIQAYAEDDTSPTPLQSDVVYKESDSDTLPAGSLKIDVDPVDNEAYYTVEAIDTDSLSYRVRFAKGAEALPAYSDVATDEVSGTNIGARVKISTVCAGITALKDNEVIYGAGYTFNTPTTTAAAQQLADKSEPIRANSSPAAIRNAVKSAWLESWPNALAVGGVTTPVVSLNAYWQLATADGTGSLKLELYENGVLYGTTKANAPAKDGKVLVLVDSVIGAVYRLVATPYSAADYGGSAGSAVEYTFAPAFGTQLTDQDGGQIVGPLSLFLSGGASALKAVQDGTTGGLVISVDIDGITALGSVDGANDYLLIRDATDGITKKVPANLVSGVGGGDHGALTGLGDDDHTQYYNATRHTKAVHDALGINADTVDGQHASAFAAASHSHAISDVTGLQSALDGKASTSHTHALDDLSDVAITTPSTGQGVRWSGTGWVNATWAIGDISELQTALDGKAATSHSHAISDVTGLQSALDGKASLSGATFTGAISGTSASFSGDVTSNTSDRRLKKDIRPVRCALWKLFRLRGVYYRWNALALEDPALGTEERVGLIAQDVAKVLPQAVRPSPVGEGYLAILPEMVLPVVIQAVQELAVLTLVAVGVLAWLL